LPFQLAAPSPDLALFSEAEQSLQGQFDGFALGFQAGCAKRIPHQLIVDHDIGSHSCISLTPSVHIGGYLAGCPSESAPSLPRLSKGDQRND
jgi:hypothetical protein